jgi:hypothetical protein
VTVRDVDAEFAFDDPDDGWFGAAAPVAEDEPAALVQPLDGPARHAPPIDEFHGYLPPVDEPYEYVAPPVESGVVDGDPTADTDRWFVRDMNLAGAAEDPLRAEVDERRIVESVAATLTVVPTRRNGFVRAPAPASWESRLSNSGAWDIKSASSSGPNWSRIALVAAAVLVGIAAVVGVVLALRTPAEQSTPVAPPSPSSVAPAPAPSTTAPVLSSPVPLPPPPGPPPPPPPSAEQINPPVVTRQYTPREDTPDEPKKPQTNVIRTPFKATPPAPPSRPNPGHSTPGDSRHHGFFG